MSGRCLLLEYCVVGLMLARPLLGGQLMLYADPTKTKDITLLPQSDRQLDMHWELTRA